MTTRAARRTFRGAAFVYGSVVSLHPLSSSRFRNALLNTVLLAAGLAVLVLLYGLAARTFTPRTAPAREANPEHLLGDVIQVEVRNGAGESGLAGTMTRYLRQRGFDVVESGNHSSFDVAESFVVDRVGNGRAARRVAAALALAAERIRTDTTNQRYLDVSIIVGRDYAALPPFSD